MFSISPANTFGAEKIMPLIFSNSRLVWPSTR
jgi:hypothetical protein